MDVVCSILSGVVVKIYDDFTENNIIQDGFIKELLHTLSSMLLGASAIGDFVFVLLLYSINFISHLNDSNAFSELKEKSILYAYPIFFVLTLPNIRNLSIPEIITLIGSTLVMYGECSVIKEEVSFRKLIMRLVLVAITVFLFIAGVYLGLFTKSLSKFFLFGIAYLTASCLFQGYSLYNKHVEVEIKDFKMPDYNSLRKAVDVALHRDTSKD